MPGRARRGPPGAASGRPVVPDRAQLGDIVQRVRDGRLRTVIDNSQTLDDADAPFGPTERAKGKTVIQIRPQRSRDHPLPVTS